MGHRTHSVQVEEGGPPARSWVTGQCTGRGGVAHLPDHGSQDSVQVEEGGPPARSWVTGQCTGRGVGAHLSDHGSQDKQCTGKGGAHLPDHGSQDSVQVEEGGPPARSWVTGQTVYR